MSCSQFCHFPVRSILPGSTASPLRHNWQLVWKSCPSTLIQDDVRLHFLGTLMARIKSVAIGSAVSHEPTELIVGMDSSSAEATS